MGLRPPFDLSEEYAANRTCDAYRAISSLVDHSIVVPSVRLSEIVWKFCAANCGGKEFLKVVIMMLTVRLLSR